MHYRTTFDALYEAKLDSVIARGLSDYETGRINHGTQADKEELAKHLASQ